MVAARREGQVIGRERELAAVERFLETVQEGPRALLIAGDGVIANTTLWGEGVAAARGRLHWILCCRPAEAERSLAFSALGDLLEPVLEETLPQLPAPQRRALEVALLRAPGEGRRAEPRGVSLAVLNLLRLLARLSPVLIAIDDLQWLDASSARVLAFALRRLEHERVGLLAAKRSGEPAPVDLERLFPETLVRLPVGAFEAEDLERLLHLRLAGASPRPLLRRVHELSGGNPFFALELARAIREAWPVSPGDPVPLPDNLADLLRARIAALPAGTQRALLVASALSHPTVPLVAAALRLSAKRPRVLDAAVDAGIVRTDGGRIVFTHPLLASAVYSAASPEQRRSVHERCAAVVSDPEERAWHVALAATGPDRGVACALERAAASASARGAPEAAAAFYELALRVTPPASKDEVRRRSIAAAERHFEAGDSNRAAELLEDVAAASPDGPARAVALARLARVRYHSHGFRAATEPLEEALPHATGEPALRAEIERDLAWVWGSLGDVPRSGIHARAALELAETVGDPALLGSALAVFAVVEFGAGGGLRADLMERALPLEEATEELPVELRPSACFGMLLKWTADLEGARSLFEGAVRRAADRGDEGALPFLFSHLSELECLAGNWDAAGRHAGDGVRIAVLTGQRSMQAMSLCFQGLVDALRGSVDSARASAEQALALAGEHEPVVHTWTVSVLGFLELSLGNPQRAHEYLGPFADLIVVMGVREPTIFRFLPDEIEALVALGEIERAAALLEPYEQQARALDRAAALAAAARCRALLAAAAGEFADAVATAEQALAEHDRVAMPFERGRTLLVKGLVERRAKQRRAARDSLEHALAIFESLGAPLWAEKARAELGRIGGRARGGYELTPNEERIAGLAAEGRTNREIADTLFLSVKTVEANLSRVYGKLGVRSRTELASRLRDGNRRLGKT